MILFISTIYINNFSQNDNIIDDKIIYDLKKIYYLKDNIEVFFIIEPNLFNCPACLESYIENINFLDNNKIESFTIFYNSKNSSVKMNKSRLEFYFLKIGLSPTFIYDERKVIDINKYSESYLVIIHKSKVNQKIKLPIKNKLELEKILLIKNNN